MIAGDQFNALTQGVNANITGGNDTIIAGDGADFVAGDGFLRAVALAAADPEILPLT